MCFLPHGRALVSSSLDGTVRAFDTMRFGLADPNPSPNPNPNPDPTLTLALAVALTRYRNFQTFVSPTPAQFTCVAVEPSGELVVAGRQAPTLGLGLGKCKGRG